MPLSFESAQTRSTFADFIHAPTFSQLNYTDKGLWSALYGDEIEALKNKVLQDREPEEIKAKLKELQSMVGRLTLSPVVYSLGLLDLQKFLRAEIKQPEGNLAAIKAIRQAWRETLQNQKAFALENFFTDVNHAINHVIEAKWEIQTAHDVLNYYWHIIEEPFYQQTVDIVKNFFNEFFIKELDEEEGIQILAENDIQEVTQQLQCIFKAAVAKLPRVETGNENLETNFKKEINTTKT